MSRRGGEENERRIKGWERRKFRRKEKGREGGHTCKGRQR